MKVVMPRGRENETLDAKFDVTPYGGCACSKVDDVWLTDDNARNNSGLGYCRCDCSYGAQNDAYNNQLAHHSSEW